MTVRHVPPDTKTATPEAPTPGDFGRLLRLPSTLALVELGRSAWLDLVAKKQAPAPVKIGRASLWVESEVRAFIAHRVHMARGGKP